jgi:hypothetical protein
MFDNQGLSHPIVQETINKTLGLKCLRKMQATKTPPRSKRYLKRSNLRKCIRKDKNYFVKAWQKISQNRLIP